LTENTLYYGDNLDILRKYIKDESVDLIYLDPPFNSKASYNILFKEPSGKPSEAQITAFEDSWHWTEETERTFHDIITTAPANVVEMMSAFRKFVGLNDMMAYLTMMCIRLLELRRVLKSTGSIYLHCDPTASHYLKILMDTIFGKKSFRNEIIWQRTHSHGSAKRWGDVHDAILFYTKSEVYLWNRIYQTYDEDYVDVKYRFHDDRGRYRLVVLTAPGTTKGESGKPWRGYDPTQAGRHWAVPQRAINALREEGKNIPDGLHGQLDLLFENDFIRFPIKKGGRAGVPEFKLYIGKGAVIQDVISDISPINSQAQERLGYPTQKPEALLERIISASSNEGATILDPFCGCGTTITASQQLKRKWIGIDITHLAINLIKWRLKNMFHLEPKRDYKVIGEPEDLEGARDLFKLNHYQFQWWASSLVNARPYGEKKKGADTGIDGFIYFSDEEGKYKKAVVQVKGGATSVKDIRDLGHVIDREKAEIGVFISLEPHTKPMIKEALQKGYYHSPLIKKDYLRIQLFTIEDLLSGKSPNIPHTVSHIKKAPSASLAKNQEFDF